MKIDIRYIVGFLGAFVLLLIGLGSFRNTPVAVGSVQDGQGYISTTTTSGSPTGSEGTAGVFQFSSTTDPTVRVSGIFGSVIVTGTSSGPFAVYDATTTNINLRTGNTSTTSITLAAFPAGMPVGTYTYDSRYQNGLIIVFSGTVGTTTFTRK